MHMHPLHSIPFSKVCLAFTKQSIYLSFQICSLDQMINNQTTAHIFWAHFFRVDDDDDIEEDDDIIK